MSAAAEEEGVAVRENTHEQEGGVLDLTFLLSPILACTQPTVVDEDPPPVDGAASSWFPPSLTIDLSQSLRNATFFALGGVKLQELIERREWADMYPSPEVWKESIRHYLSGELVSDDRPIVCLLSHHHTGTTAEEMARLTLLLSPHRLGR